MTLEEALTRALQGHQVKIEVRERGGYFEARRAGEPGRVFDKRRSAAISKARSWRAFHPKQGRPKGEHYLKFEEPEVQRVNS